MNQAVEKEKNEVLKDVPKEHQQIAWDWYVRGHAAGYRCCFEQGPKKAQDDVMDLAKEHVKPLGRGVKILEVRRIDDRIYYVKFEHKGHVEEQYVGA